MKFFVNTSEGKRKQVLLLKKKEGESMPNNSSQEPVIPLTDEEFNAIKEVIQAEAAKIMEDYKSRGFSPVHLIAVAGVLLTMLIPNSTLDRSVISMTAACMQVIGESNREKANKILIN
jgi:hypothetical protein